jgi:hypothetical protein
LIPARPATCNKLDEIGRFSDSNDDAHAPVANQKLIMTPFVGYTKTLKLPKLLCAADEKHLLTMKRVNKTR